MAARQLGRWRVSDTPGSRCSPAGARRARDQEGEEPEEEEGELVCRLMEGRSGDWMGHDGKGRSLRVSRSKDGALEIRHLAEPAGKTEDDELEDVTGAYPGLGGDPARAARATSTGDALTAYKRTGRSEYHMGGLAEYQRQLNEHYGR